MANDLVSFKKNLGSMIERGEFALPSTVRPEAFRNAAIVAFQTTPAIRKATPESLFTALRHIAYQGVMPDGREAAIVVYGDKAQANTMVAGLRKIARNSGQILAMWDDVVYEGEEIIYRFVDGVRTFEHVNEDGTPLKAMKRGGTIIGAYAAAKLRDGTVEMEPMPLEAIEKRRLASPNQKGPNPTGIWKDWYEEMARKTAVRALCKRLPMSSEDYLRLEADPTFRKIDEMKDVTPTETTEERLRRVSMERKEEPEQTAKGELLEPEEDDRVEYDDGTRVAYDENLVFPGEKAFNDGMKAFKAKKGSDDNPHKENPDYSNWHGGWLQARDFAEAGAA